MLKICGMYDIIITSLLLTRPKSQRGIEMKKNSFNVVVTPMHSGVTGSCFHINAEFPNGVTYPLIIDCGLFQGRDEESLNGSKFPTYFKSVDNMIITHNHVDHCGRVPNLVHYGFKGEIHCSMETAGLLDKAWKDCEKIESWNAKFEKRPQRFTLTHVNKALRMLRPFEYGVRYQIYPGMWVTLYPNAHVFGAAMVLLELEYPYEGYEPINFLFTGDYNDRNPFFDVMEVPKELREMPLHIVCEATYGDNTKTCDREKVFEHNIVAQAQKRKKILIPTFAFERGQVILATLRKLQEKGTLDSSIPIYLDSKLIMAYTEHYARIAPTMFRKNMQAIYPKNYHPVKNRLQREELINQDQPMIIVTTGGMGSHGPVRQYIKHFISNPNGVIHFTGYLCEGTVGRNMMIANENGTLTDIGGKLVDVDCLIFHTSEFSSHASQDVLLDFLSQFSNVRSINLNHGEMESKEKMARAIIKRKLAREVGNLTADRRYYFNQNELEVVKEIKNTVL